MTVNTDISTASYIGNGSTAIFTVPFYFLVDSDLLVTHKSAATGAITTMVLNSDYTVTGAGNEAGGSITTIPALPNGDTIFIERNVDAVQQTAYPPNSPFPAASHEQALDRLTMLIQQVLSKLTFGLFRDPLNNTYNAGGNTISNAADAVNPTDLTTQQQVDSKIAAAATGVAPADVALYSHLASTATGEGAALLGWPAGFGINQAGTGQFFAQNGAGIHRFNDRIFLGGATANDGAYPTVTKDWLTDFYDANGYTLGYTLNGQLSVLSSTSSASSEMVVSGVQSAHFPGNGAYGTAFYGVGVNNGVSYTNMGVNAFYGEVHNTASNLNSAYVCEFDTRTTVDPSVPTPYNQGTVVGMQMGSGAGTTGVTFTGSISGATLTVASVTYALPYGASPNSYQIQVGSKLYGVGIPAGTTVTALGTGTGGVGTYTISTSLTVASETMVATDQYDASCAFQIVGNPMKFKVGINFFSDAISGCDGVNGAGTAIAFALGHQCNWYNSSGQVIGRIASYATTQANTGEIQFNDNGIEFRSFNTGGAAIAYFQGVANGANWLTFNNGVAGSPALIGTNGSDSNIDISIAPKGTGVVRFGAYTAGTVAQAGYITIKDAAGTTRRLLVG
ncbi:MAG TPA: hypothetical protein VN017_05450 [Pseudoxanthomonas sp.]|nr:hypothetical protein [Pseudoxanthomonas sp.]